MDVCDVAETIQETSKKRRKGVTNMAQYKSEVIKKAQINGSSYTNYTGKECAELKPGVDCKLFKASHPDANVSYKFYLKVCNEDFSLSFGRPQIDTCYTCEELSQLQKNHSKESRNRGVLREQKIALKITRFMNFTHSSDYKGTVQARDFTDGLVEHTFHIAHKRNTPVELLLTKAYSIGFLPMNEKKISDLRKFQPFLPDEEDIQVFYNELFAWPTIRTDSSTEHEMLDLKTRSACKTVHKLTRRTLLAGLLWRDVCVE
ncbi:hypothetical protein PR048_009262, partial [Dryococelus australis]